MIKLENYEVVGWEHALRGMRNPHNSWANSDSAFKGVAQTDILGDDDKVYKQDVYFDALNIGEKDHNRMMNLSKGGPVHAKYRRMIVVYVDITAPLYWWKEFDTYKVGTVANSCSTIHKIADKEFTIEDFSCEHLWRVDQSIEDYLDDHDKEAHWNVQNPMHVMDIIIGTLNYYREDFIKTNDKKSWHQMIQLLPSSYNQKRTVMLNYEVLANIYKWRKDHKLTEWHDVCSWIKTLPYSEVITGGIE